MGKAVENPRRPATIYDVAMAAGVSHQTVSRYLRGYEGIRPETRDRVVAALTDLGYRPNLSARTLKSGRSHRIAALTHELSQVGPARVASAASVAARDAGFLLDFVPVDAQDPDGIAEALDELQQSALAGILVLASTDEMVSAFEKASVRVPFHLHTEPEGTGPWRTSDSEFGIPALVQHLVSLGHRRFVHLAGPSNWSVSRNRAHAFETAIARIGGVLVETLTGDWSPRSGYEALLHHDLGAATAVLCANDQMAIGAMLALKQRGLRIPEDVSVTGIDDVPESGYLDPPLTTLRHDFETTGRNSVHALLAMIDGEAREVGEWPHPRLILRASTAAPGADR